MVCHWTPWKKAGRDEKRPFFVYTREWWVHFFFYLFVIAYSAPEGHFFPGSGRPKDESISHKQQKANFLDPFFSNDVPSQNLGILEAFSHHFSPTTTAPVFTTIEVEEASFCLTNKKEANIPTNPDPPTTTTFCSGHFSFFAKEVLPTPRRRNQFPRKIRCEGI